MKPWGWYGFLSGFPSFDAFLIVVSMGKRCVLHLVFKTKYFMSHCCPHLLSAVAVEISSSRKPWEGVKSASGGDSE